MVKALSVLGLARRAGRLRWGYETAVDALRRGECALVLVTQDLSEKTRKNMRFEADRAGAALLETAFTMEDIVRRRVCGKAEAGAWGSKRGACARLARFGKG